MVLFNDKGQLLYYKVEADKTMAKQFQLPYNEDLSRLICEKSSGQQSKTIVLGTNRCVQANCRHKQDTRQKKICHVPKAN